MQASTSVLSSRYKWLGPQNALLISFPFNAHLILYAFNLVAHHTWCFFALPFLVTWFCRMNGATTTHGGGGHDFDHFAQQYRFWDHSQIWKEFPQPSHAWMNLFHRGVDLTTDCIYVYLFHIMMKGTQDAKMSIYSQTARNQKKTDLHRSQSSWLFAVQVWRQLWCQGSW